MAGNIGGNLAATLSLDAAGFSKGIQDSIGQVNSLGSVLGKFGESGSSIMGTIGEAASSMEAGPVGIIAEMVGAAGQAIGSGINTISGMLSGPGGFIDGIGAGLKTALGDGLLAQVLDPIIDAVGGAAKEVLGFVGKADPGALNRLSDAFGDMQAVIGQRAVPLVELFTDGIRTLGDTINTILPDTNTINDAIQPLKDLGGELRIAFGELATALKPLVNFGFGVLANELRGVVVPLTIFTNQLTTLGSFLGLSGGLNSSFGAAAGPARIMSGEQVSRDALTSVLSSMGGGGEQSPINTIAEDVHTIVEFLKNPAAKVTETATDAAKGMGRQFLRFASHGFIG